MELCISGSGKASMKPIWKEQLRVSAGHRDTSRFRSGHSLNELTLTKHYEQKWWESDLREIAPTVSTVGEDLGREGDKSWWRHPQHLSLSASHKQCGCGSGTSRSHYICQQPRSNYSTTGQWRWPAPITQTSLLSFWPTELHAYLQFPPLHRWVRHVVVAI